MACTYAYRAYIVNQSDFESPVRLRSALAVLQDLFKDFALLSVAVVRGSPPTEETDPNLSRNLNHYQAIRDAAAYHSHAHVRCIVLEDDILLQDLIAARAALLRAAIADKPVTRLCAEGDMCAYMIGSAYARSIDDTDVWALASRHVSPAGLEPVFANGSRNGAFLGMVNPLAPLPASLIEHNPRVLFPMAMELYREGRADEAKLLLIDTLGVLSMYSPHHIQPRILKLIYAVVNGLPASSSSSSSSVAPPPCA